MPSQAYKDTFAIVFRNPSTLRTAFFLGVACSHNMLPISLYKEWIVFLKYDFPNIYIGDIFSDDRYRDLQKSLTELGSWSREFARANMDLIVRAEKAAPKEAWIPKMTMKEWILTREACMERDGLLAVSSNAEAESEIAEL